MDEGILGVRLVPAWNSPSIRGELKAALDHSELLQASVAFWTVNDTLFGAGLAAALGHSSGFLCVDVHLPTDIDALCRLAAERAHVRLYQEEIATYTDAGRKEPPCLLHAKMLLFRSKDRTAELWVGSHNWTNRAILGLNVEASVVIHLRDSSTLFADAAAYLEKIKDISGEFDPAKVEHYKQLQRNLAGTTTPVIELEAEDADLLGDVTVTLFGTDTNDLRELGTVRHEVYISLSKPESDDEHLYPATILQSGVLAAYDHAASGLSFSPRRYAFRRGRRFPSVLPEGPIAADVSRDAAYFATLRLAALDTNVRATPVPPKTVVWEATGADASPLVRRLDSHAKTLLFHGKEPRVKRPHVETEPPQAQTLSERKQLPDSSLVTRRLLRSLGA